MVPPEENWTNYLNSKREQFLLNRKSNLGLDYLHDSKSWDVIFEQEWNVLQGKLTPPEDLKNLPENIEELIDPLPTPEIIEKIKIGDTLINLYYFEDFVMLSNQGIFREQRFLIDKGRKWEKKAIDSVTQYGYQHIGYYEDYLEFVSVS